MAGAFGYEKENDHYEVGVAAGERVLLPEVRRAARDDLIIADGFSCQEQIEQQTDRAALHVGACTRKWRFTATRRSPASRRRRGLAREASPHASAWRERRLDRRRRRSRPVGACERGDGDERHLPRARSDLQRRC